MHRLNDPVPRIRGTALLHRKIFLKLLQVLKNGMLQEKMGKNLVTNYPIFGPVELPPI